MGGGNSKKIKKSQNNLQNGDDELIAENLDQLPENNIDKQSDIESAQQPNSYNHFIKYQNEVEKNTSQDRQTNSHQQRKRRQDQQSSMSEDHMFKWEKDSAAPKQRQKNTGFKIEGANMVLDEEEEYYEKRQQIELSHKHESKPQRFQKNIDDLNMTEIQKNKDNSLNLSQELSPILQHEETQQEKQQKLQKKIQNVQKVSRSPFKWPQQGICKVIMVSYSFEYNLGALALRLKKNYNVYTQSKLMWRLNPTRSSYDFVLQDEEVYDTVNNTSQKLPFNVVNFVVDAEGNYIGISDEQEYLQKYKTIHKQIKEQNIAPRANTAGSVSTMRGGKKKRRKVLNPQKIIQSTEQIMKNIWNLSVTQWVDKSQYEITGKVDENDIDLLYVANHNRKDPKELQEFLRNQLQNKKFYDSCFNSKKTFRDRLKLWSIEDNDDQIELPEYLQNQKKQVRFPLLEKIQSSQAQIEEFSGKPHVVMTNESKKIVLENENSDLFVDVNQELKLFVYQWDTASDAANESYFLKELTKFKDICDTQLKNTIKDLSRVTSLPLQFRSKVRPAYFQEDI